MPRKRSFTAAACWNPGSAGGPVVVGLGRIVGMPESFAPAFMLSLSIPRSLVGAVLVIVSLNKAVFPRPQSSLNSSQIPFFFESRGFQKSLAAFRKYRFRFPRNFFSSQNRIFTPLAVGLLDSWGCNFAECNTYRLRDCPLRLTGPRGSHTGADSIFWRVIARLRPRGPVVGAFGALRDAKERHER